MYGPPPPASGAEAAVERAIRDTFNHWNDAAEPWDADDLVAVFHEKYARYAPHPLPAAPAAVDERAAFEAWAVDRAERDAVVENEATCYVEWTAHGVPSLHSVWAEGTVEQRSYLRSLAHDWETWQARAALAPAAAQEGGSFDSYLHNLAQSVGCDMEAYALPSSHGNDRLRWAALIQLRLLALMGGLSESVKLQSHYAGLLNQYDGGARLQFKDAEEWIARLAMLATEAQGDEGRKA